MLASIIITAYNRAKLLEKTLESIYKQKHDYEVIVIEDGNDGGATKDLCWRYPVRYVQRLNKPPNSYNPSVLNNIGIKMAKGEILLIQNAEVMHVTPNTIEMMVEPILKNKKITQYASCMSQNQQGKDIMWYCHSIHNRRPLFFCQSIDKEIVLKMRGFDEDYILPGYDDNDFADRLSLLGIQHVFRDDILVIHQWHSMVPGDATKENAKLYLQKKGSNPIRNLEREWGILW